MNKRMIVSDVGGTNGRFGVAEFSVANNLPSISAIKIYPCNQYGSFSDMLGNYLSDLKGEIPKIARFAIAGEMEPRRGNLWHFNWNISADQLEQQFNFESVTLLNDYEALIYAIPSLNTEDLVTISSQKTGLDNAPFSAFGVGSGLGAAIGLPTPTGTKVVPTEIGHISFGPKSTQQLELQKYYQTRIDHVSVETFLSGRGLIRIYEFLNDKKTTITAPEITAIARKGNDDACVRTVKLFLDILASVAGDIALAQGAKGGIYIGGGIVPKIVDLIDPDRFMEHFRRKGPMQGYVDKIPVHVITAEIPALLGAAIDS